MHIAPKRHLCAARRGETLRRERDEHRVHCAPSFAMRIIEK
jgi:hypothetical protein